MIQFVILKFILVLMFTSIGYIESSKILILHPLHGGSHKVQLRHLGEKLIERGHEVTIVSFLNVGDTPCRNQSFEGNLTQYTLTVENFDGKYPYITREIFGRFRFPIELFWEKGHNPHYLPTDAFRVTEALCRTLMSSKNLQNFLKSENFDAAIIDLISNECGLGFLHLIQIHTVIGYWALFPVGGEIDYLSPSFTPPSYVPAFFSKLTQDMTFTQRMWNTYMKFGSFLVMSIQLYLSDMYMSDYNNPWIPKSEDMIANLSGILINTDLSLYQPILLPQNAIFVGCMQCKLRSDPLPMELENFMESSGPNGVILFSMGASFDIKVAKNLIPHIFGAFSKLDQKILMKGNRAEMEIFFEIPKNVKILNWIPQQDILGHRKTKLFFGHFGLHGVNEAIWHSKPIIGIAIFGDQFDVQARLEEKGLAIGLSKTCTELEIFRAIQTILTNTSYSTRMAEASKLFRDQKEHPMTRALWFVEYLMRNRGGEHLKSASRFLNFYQLYCIDVFFGFLLIILISLLILCKMCIQMSKMLFHVRVAFGPVLLSLMGRKPEENFGLEVKRKFE